MTANHTRWDSAKGAVGARRNPRLAQGSGLTVEVHCADVAEQLFAVDASHARAEPRVSVAELPVHAVQGVGHGVHGVHHELDLSLLLVAGVAADFFQTCRRNSER